jgi:hypothetical protein
MKRDTAFRVHQRLKRFHDLLPVVDVDGNFRDTVFPRIQAGGFDVDYCVHSSNSLFI